jgi:hypothetical protein
VHGAARIGRRTAPGYNYLRATNLEVGLLLHFGPEARFYRVIHRKQKEKENRSNQENPLHPDETLNSVARAPEAAVNLLPQGR